MSNVINSGNKQNPATTTASDGKTPINTVLRNTAISEIEAGRKDFQKVQEYTNKAMAASGNISARILRIARVAFEVAQGMKLDGEKTIAQAKHLFKLALDDGKAALLASVGEGDNAKAEAVHAYIEYLDKSSTIKQVRSNLNVAISKGLNLAEKDKDGEYVFQTEGSVRKAVEALKPEPVAPVQTPAQKVAKAAEQTADAIVPISKEEPEVGQKLRIAIVGMLQILDEATKVCDEDSLVHVISRTTKDFARMIAEHKSEGPGAASKVKAA